jgi:hypothetical protein
MPQLGGHEIDGHRELRGREDFLADAGEDFLGGHVFAEALAEDREEMRLLDVFFAGKRGNVGGG